MKAGNFTGSRWLGYAPVWGIFTLFVAIVLSARGIITISLTHDLYFIFDGVWRIYAGQTPFVDFPSPIGIAYFLPFELLRHLEPFSLLTLFHAQLLVAAGLLVMATLTLPKRLSPPLFFLVTFGILAVVISPREAGASPLVFAHLAPYNRWCEGATMLLAPLLLLRPTRSPARSADSMRARDMTAATVLALVMLFLLHLKVTFFLGSLGLVVVGLLFRQISFSTVAWAAGIFILASGVLEATTHVHRPYLASIAMAGAATLEVYGQPRLLTSENGAYVALGYVLAVAVFLWLSPSLEEARSRFWLRRWWPVFAVALFGIALATAMNTQLHPQNEIPLAGTILVVAAQLARNRQSETEIGWARQILAHAIVVIGALLVPVQEAASVVAHAAVSWSERVCSLPAWRGSPGDKLLFTRGALLEDGVSRPGGCANIQVSPATMTLSNDARLEAARLTEAHSLLQGRTSPNDSILALDFSNPYPFLTGTLPPHQALLWWHFGRSYSLNARPDPAVILGSVDYVLQRKLDLPFDANGPELWNLFGAGVERDFDSVAEGRLWRLWSRKVPLTRSAGIARPSAREGD